jgi:hypothetical protein
MNLERIKQTAWIGDEWVRGEIKGIVMVFHGLGHAAMKDGPGEIELEWGDAGGLVVFPYTGPWHWSTAPVREYLDDLIGSIREHYCGGRAVPIILTGGSLGGHTSIDLRALFQTQARGLLRALPGRRREVQLQ